MRIFILTLSFPFFLMLAMGPFPFEVLGLPIDHLATAFLFCAAFLGSLSASYKKIRCVDIVLLAYLISLCPSVLLSSDFDQSLERYCISILYAAILYMLMRIDFSARGYNALSFIALLTFFSVTSICLFVYYFSGYSGNVRFALANDYSSFDVGSYNGESRGVDPNMTAVGLVLLFIFSYPRIGLVKSVAYRILMVCLSLICIFIVLSIFASRTAFVCVLLSFAPIICSVLSRKQRKTCLAWCSFCLYLRCPYLRTCLII